MDTALLAALVAGACSLVGVILTVYINIKLTHREIQSSEGIALRTILAKTDADLRVELGSLNLKLQRCEDERTADAAQRKADAERHMADEEQRRVDAERHRIDEERHSNDTAEILRTRQQLVQVTGDLDKLRGNLRDWTNTITPPPPAEP